MARTETGRAKDELVQDAIAGYFQELAQVREMLDSRYDEIKIGRVEPLDGEEKFCPHAFQPDYLRFFSITRIDAVKPTRCASAATRGARG